MFGGVGQSRRSGGGGIDGVGHHLHHHIPHNVAEPRRKVDGGVSLVCVVDHGGDDGGRGVIVLVPKNRGQVVTRRHLLRAPLHMLPQSHHKNLEGVVVLRSENALNTRIFH